MIENNCKLVYFNKFAEEHTKSLCDYIDNLVGDFSKIKVTI